MKHINQGTTSLKLIIAVFLLLMFSTAPANAQWALVVNEQSVIINASSYCDEFEDIKFTPDQVFNFDQDRPWMASKNFDPKNEEWIKLTFSKPARLLALKIGPSFGSGKYYYDYSRLKKFQVVLETDKKIQKRNYDRSFDSFPERDNVLFFSDEPMVKSVKIIIQDVYPGKKNSFPLIGFIEPIVETKGRLISSSWALEEAIMFLKSCRSAERAFSFVPEEGIAINKTARNANPLDHTYSISKKNKFTRKTLRDSFAVWSGLCQSLSANYIFNSYQATGYMWKDPASSHAVFQISPCLTSDELSTAVFSLTRQKTTTKIKKDNKEETVTIMKTVVPMVEVQDEVYTP